MFGKIFENGSHFFPKTALKIDLWRPPLGTKIPKRVQLFCQKFQKGSIWRLYSGTPPSEIYHEFAPRVNTMSETIFSNSLIFQEFVKLEYMLNLKISKSQNLTDAKISRPKVIQIMQNFQDDRLYIFSFL